jgi:hypothetical protein
LTEEVPGDEKSLDIVVDLVVSDLPFQRMSEGPRYSLFLDLNGLHPAIYRPCPNNQFFSLHFHASRSRVKAAFTSSASSGETRTEIQIQEALQRLMDGRMRFVIAHRLSTIRNADQVLVINHGEIIVRGTHEELLAVKGFYYRLYMSQFKGINGDEDFERITLDDPVPVRQQQGGVVGLTDMQGTFPERMRVIADVFLNNGAVSPETAKTPEELGLPPQFRVMHGRMGQTGLFLEHDGRYYLSEEHLKQMQKLSGK